MSQTKKKKKKDEYKQLLLLLAGVVFVALILVVAFTKIFPLKDYYKIESRVDKVKTEQVDSKVNTYATVGWVRVQGTNIDLPVIHNSENYEYPTETEPYAWLSNYSPGFHNHLEIQGHNIMNLSSYPQKSGEGFDRFEELMSYSYYDFAKDNKYIQLTLGDKDYLYKVFMVGFVPPSFLANIPVEDDFTEEQMKWFLKYLKPYNIYKYDVDVNAGDDVLTLVTCTRFYGIEDFREFYVVGRLVRKGEHVNNYRVEKSDNYKEIEEKMKGDDENEEV